MINQVILLGRIANDIQITNDTETQSKITLTLAIQRNFKNVDGIYETDLIDVLTYGDMATKILDYCSKNDMVAIRGRMQKNDNNLEIVAERISFLSTKKEHNDNLESEEE